MINTSEEYKKAVLEKRKFLAKATCLLKDGTLLEFDKSRLMMGGVTISDATSSSGSFDIGAAIVNQLTMKLNNMDEVLSAYDFTDAQITVWAGLQLENRVEWLKKGVFNASDPTETPAVLTLKALDNMSKFDKVYDGDIVFPSSIQGIVQHCCAKCGVLLASEKIPNGDYIINNPVQGDNLTYRVLVSYCAVVAGCYARCNPDGALELKWYNRTAFSENGTHVDIKKFSSLSVSNVDVVITGIRVTASDGKDEKLKGETYLAGTEGYVLSISGNPFIEYGNAKTIASMLAERIVGMSFRPMNASCIGDPSIEAGDAAVLTDRKGRTYNCYLTSLTYSVGDYTSISCDAEPAARHSADRFKEIDKIISDIKEETRHELSQYGKYLDQMNGLAINAMGYYETVEIQDDGSRITYMHDKPLMSESMVIYKKSIDGYFWSKDGGKTWTSGIDKNGNAVMNVIAAIGLHAEWIASGRLQVSDDEGNIIFLVDMDTKQVLISGDSVQIGGRPVQDVINNGITESKNYSDKRLSDYANTVTKDIENLQSQVDGQVEDYYYDYEPSMQNIPASQWTTTEERKKHIGDRFFWKSKGYAYRFMENNGVWGWTLLQDTDITKAMQTAQNAKDTADGKRRTFITQPVPPYDIGDMWANGTDILTCSVSRASGASYVSTDWEKLNKYTDDTVANQALEEARKAANITISLTNDFQGIPANADGTIISPFPDVKTTVQVFYGQSDISSECTYKITKSTGITGLWDNTKRTYTVTGLSEDNGYVDIEAGYLSIFRTIKRFNVVKTKNGGSGFGIRTVCASEKVIYKDGNVLSPSKIEISVIKQNETSQQEIRIGYEIHVIRNNEKEDILTSGQSNHGISLDLNSFSNFSWENARAIGVGIRSIDYEYKDIVMFEILEKTKPLTHEDVFNLLTQNGLLKGIYKQGNELYINATYLVSGIISDKMKKNYWDLDTGDFRLSSSDFKVDDQLIKDLIKAESSKAQNFNVYTYPSELHIERSANGQIIDEFPDTKIEIDVMMGDKTVDKECEIELEVSGNVAAVLRKNSTGKYYIDVLNINRYEGYVIVKAMYKNRLYAEKKIPIYRIERNANESTKAYYATAWPTTIKILKTGELHEYSKKLEIMTFRTAIINGKKRNVLNHSKVEYQLRGFDDSKKTYTTLETKTVNGECYFDLTFDVVKKYNSLEATAKYFYDNNEIEATVKVVIPIIYEAINLTHEDIFNLLTNNGEIKGIYRENGQLYISFTYAKGGTMTLGGTGNASGLMSLQDTNGREFGKIDNEGFTIRDTATGNKTRLIPTGIVREEGGKSMPYHYLTFFGEKTISKEEFSGGGNTECFYEGTIDLLINQLPVGFRLKKENVQLQVTSLESGMDLNSIIMASLTNMSLNVLSVRYLNMDSCWSIRFRCDCSYLTQVNNNMKPRYIAPKSMTIGYTIIG